MRNHLLTIKIRVLSLSLLGLSLCAMLYFNNRTSLAHESLVIAEPAAAALPQQPPCQLLPIDVKVPGAGYGEGGNVAPPEQGLFDIFSWQSFAALNCQANPNAPPPKDPADHNPRVWETFVDALDLYGVPDKTLASYQAKTNTVGGKVLRLSAKNVHFRGGDLEFLEATGYPLIDKNLNFVVYEVRINPIEAEYVTSHGLNTYNGQKKFFQNPKNKVSFPPGSIEIKAAWRLLDATKGDDLSKFYTRKASIYMEGKFTEHHQPLYVPNVTVGLVGLHIIRKTTNFSQWVWGTFEQVGNDLGQYDPYKNNSFFNAECNSCPINSPPTLLQQQNKYKWALTPPYAIKYVYSFGKKQFGTQVVRVSDIFPETAALNQQWQASQGIAGTVWQNYQLIGTQWEAFNFKFPKILANTTMETYNQASSSCIDCHHFATTSFGDQPADFSFMMGIVEKPTGK